MPISICQNCSKEFKHGYSSKGLFCSTDCSNEYRKKQSRIKHEELFKEGKLSYRDRIKKFIEDRDGYKCSCCGINSWQGKPITLWLDHIDGDASNNNPENFRLICPNCDSQTETFGAKNYGKGRKTRGLPQYG